MLLSILVLLGNVYIELNKSKIKHPSYNKQIKAAQLMKQSMDTISQAKIARSMEINPELDPNQTGLIGKEFTPMTTTLGNLEAKRTSTNPDFAALLINYFHELNLKKGDTIAIGSSGSFPGLILAVLSAAQVMELEPLLIYSLGSSTYGANISNFTFLDMLKVLNKKDLITYEPIAFSLGGANDTAAGIEDKEVFMQIAEAKEYPFIYEEDIPENIEVRINHYQREASGPIQCFINTGGSAVNLGSTSSYLNLPTGLNKSLPLEILAEEKGVLFEFAKMGKPIIHLLNIRDLAQSQGIKVDPVPFPPPGESDVYYQIHYNYTLILFLLILLTIIITLIVKKYR
ncbi:MAG: poly-gamma-glutamate system protein [bacterium]